MKQALGVWSRYEIKCTYRFFRCTMRSVLSVATPALIQLRLAVLLAPTLGHLIPGIEKAGTLVISIEHTQLAMVTSALYRVS